MSDQRRPAFTLAQLLRRLEEFRAKPEPEQRRPRLSEMTIEQLESRTEMFRVMAANASASSHASLNLLVTRMEEMITARKLAENGPPDAARPARGDEDQL
jgi:hypothetical protein